MGLNWRWFKYSRLKLVNIGYCANVLLLNNIYAFEKIYLYSFSLMFMKLYWRLFGKLQSKSYTFFTSRVKIDAWQHL